MAGCTFHNYKYMNDCGGIDTMRLFNGSGVSYLRADFTVTFGLPKPGNIFYPGYTHCGELFVSHISFPPEHYNQDHLAAEINIPAGLPVRNPQGYKGSFGSTLFAFRNSRE